MARQTINIGTVANDGTGDALRDAFDKVNDNFLGVTATYCNLRLNTTQSIANATTAIVSWTTERSDPDGIVTVPATYVTVPAGMTECRVTGNFLFAANATGLRHVIVMHRNTSDVLVSYLAQAKIPAVANGSETTGVIVASGWLPVTAGNRIATGVEQTSGGALNVLGFAADTGGVSTYMEFEFR